MPPAQAFVGTLPDASDATARLTAASTCGLGNGSHQISSRARCVRMVTSAPRVGLDAERRRADALARRDVRRDDLDGPRVDAAHHE